LKLRDEFTASSHFQDLNVNRYLPLRWTIHIVAVSALLSGCGMFHRHHDNTYYSKAQEAKPLEVPPDLDAPVTSNELTVPAAGTASASASAAAAPAPNGAPPQVSLSGDSLHVSDSVGHAWTRVGLALERAQVGTISERNEAAHSYTLEVAGLKAAAPVPAAPEHHWYTRVLHPFGGGGSTSNTSKASAPPVNGHLTVTVSADGEGARVDVAGPAGDVSAAEAARRVLQALRERMS
jgi:uncharacterized lipoprotein